MGVVKPPPLKIGDRYYYTLSSYDPVEVEIVVPRIIDEEVDLAIPTLLANHLTENSSDESMSFDEALESIPEELTDEWVAQHLKDSDITTVEELYDFIRKELERAHAHAAERIKEKLCIEKLSERLCQEPPPDEIAQSCEVARLLLEEKLREMDLELNSSAQEVLGMSPEEFDQLITKQGKILAKTHAALNAFAAKRKLTVSEEEFPELLDMSPVETRDAIAAAKSNHQYETLRQTALNAKVTKVLVAECSCTYHIETEEEAHERIQYIMED